MASEETSYQLFCDLMVGQRAIVESVTRIDVSLARLGQTVIDHIDRQADRTSSRDLRCERSERRSDALEETMSDIRLTMAGYTGGRNMRANIMNACMALSALIFSAWTAIKG